MGYEKKNIGNHGCALIVCANQAYLNQWKTKCIRGPNSSKTSPWNVDRTDDCQCNPGYTDAPARASCTLCAPGTYKGYGNGECIPCPKNSGCAMCPLDAVWEDWECRCNYGKIHTSVYGDLQCESCPAGTYKFENFQEECTVCPEFMWSPPGLRFCHSIPYYSQLVIGVNGLSIGWMCNAGFRRDNTQKSPCVLCAAGTYKGSTGNTAGEYLCETCPSDSFSPAFSVEESACLNTGYAKGLAPDPFCEACAPGSYKQVPGNQACTLCEAGQYVDTRSPVTVCTACPTGFYRTLQDAVSIPCRDNSFTQGTGSVSRASCLCHAGYHGGISDGECIVCPSNSFTEDAGHNSQASCLCDPGYSGNAAQESCVKCVVGKAKPDRGNTLCPLCNSNEGRYSSVAGAENCVQCRRGENVRNGIRCELCVPGKFWTPDYACQACLLYGPDYKTRALREREALFPGQEHQSAVGAFNVPIEQLDPTLCA